MAVLKNENDQFLKLFNFQTGQSKDIQYKWTVGRKRSALSQTWRSLPWLIGPSLPIWTVIDLSGIEMGGQTELNSRISPSYRPSTVHFGPWASSLDFIHFAYHFLGVRWTLVSFSLLEIISENPTQCRLHCGAYRYVCKLCLGAIPWDISQNPRKSYLVMSFGLERD